MKPLTMLVYLQVSLNHCEFHYCEKHMHYSHNNPFAGKHMGRHVKLYMLQYALGPNELVLSYGLGYGLECELGRRFGYE